MEKNEIEKWVSTSPKKIKEAMKEIEDEVENIDKTNLRDKRRIILDKLKAYKEEYIALRNKINDTRAESKAVYQQLHECPKSKYSSEERIIIRALSRLQNTE